MFLSVLDSCWITHCDGGSKGERGRIWLLSVKVTTPHCNVIYLLEAVSKHRKADYNMARTAKYKKSWDHLYINALSEAIDLQMSGWDWEERITHTFISKEPDAKFKRWTEIEMRDDMPSIHRGKLYTSLSCRRVRNIIATKLRSL